MPFVRFGKSKNCVRRILITFVVVFLHFENDSLAIGSFWNLSVIRLICIFRVTNCN